MAKIRQSNLDGSVITGNTTLNETANVSDLLLVYDQSTGTLKQVNRTNLLGFPTISSVSPTNATSGDGTGNYTFTITGSGFNGSSASLINTSGTGVTFDTVTVDSDTQITGVIAKSSLPNSGEPYDVKVTGSVGLSTTLDNQITIDASPVYNTAAGSLGSLQEGSTISPINIEAYDPESAGNVTFEIQSGALPAGLSATTVHENGVSKYRITGTLPTPGSETVYSFVLRAVDAASNTSSRSFSITARLPVQSSFTSSGTFSVPVGVTSIEVLVVGGGGAGSTDNGGGGGAGGLIFFPSYPVTPNGTITVTVGCGASTIPNTTAQTGPIPVAGDTSFGSPGDPGLGSGGVLTAKGGGPGGGPNGQVEVVPGISGRKGVPGGSGGGGARFSAVGCAPAPGCAGTATQPTQPGNSGAYGFGSNGGTGSPGTQAGGGGGGAGQVGSPGDSGQGGNGGNGKAYTIADGTTPVYYAGGGGGGTENAPSPGGTGGGGGGGNGGNPSSLNGQAGQANKGGAGGGGGGGGPGTGGAGGKGIVIVEY